MSPVLKARLPGDVWATLGGVGVGVAPGGSTGQVLTKKSATDYDVEWGTNQPVLANNTALVGYRTGGATQGLIGVYTDDNIYLGFGGLAAGKKILTSGDLQCTASLIVQGTTTLLGPLVSPDVLRAYGTVNSGPPSFSTQRGMAGVGRVSTGRFRVTFATAIPTAVVLATVYATETFPNCLISVGNITSTTVDVYMSNRSDGQAVEYWFHVAVMGL